MQCIVLDGTFPRHRNTEMFTGQKQHIIQAVIVLNFLQNFLIFEYNEVSLEIRQTMYLNIPFRFISRRHLRLLSINLRTEKLRCTF